MAGAAGRLRERLESSELLVAPFVYDALQAKIAEATGFEAVYMSGFGTAAARGLPDLGLLSLTEMVQNANFIAGANKPDTHYKNANFPRDFQAEIVADIANAEAGHACPRCGKALAASRGIEVGHVFKLGTIFSETLGAHYLDRDGVRKPIVMGSYGIGVGRLLAAAIEQNHDEQGIIWPAPIAPYQVHLVTLAGKDTSIVETSDRLYQTLLDADIEVLYDDRDERAGVKFADADLIGLPLRLTVSAKSIGKGGIELKRRDSKDAEIVAESDLLARLRTEMQTMFDEIAAKVVEVPFK